jgi:3-isopropylmalate/(R)-2-methylmalate dehydratase small subunit
MHQFGGKAILLDRDNINTDEIMPAKYLTLIEKEPLKPFLLEDLIIDTLDPKTEKWDEYSVVISKSNFGCGSSREMAVWGFEVNGITTIIASSFARIFRENTFNTGILAIELGKEQITTIFSTFTNTEKLSVSIDLESQEISITDQTSNLSCPFQLTSLQKDLVSYGGLVNLANEKY